MSLDFGNAKTLGGIGWCSAANVQEVNGVGITHWQGYPWQGRENRIHTFS
jgi:hypothetical protein